MKKKIILSSLFFIICILLINTSSFAYFMITNFDIDAKLSETGDLNVTETITYCTDEEVNGLTRKVITRNPKNIINSADTFELYNVQVGDEDCKQVAAGKLGDNGVYEYAFNGDNEYNIKLYSPFTENYKTIKYNYILRNVAVKYNDVGELFWNFISDEWDCNIDNLTIRITLPERAINENIYVFGHGSDNGTFQKNGNYIVLRAHKLNAYQPLDARILFSKNAISDSTKNIDKDVLENYINQEEGLSKKMEKRKIIGNWGIEEIALSLSIIIIAFGFICYILFDKEISVEKQKYVREIPCGLQPELLQYIFYRKIKPNSFYVAVLNLVKLGVYRIENAINKVGEKTQILIYNEKHTAKLTEYQQNIVKNINRFLESDDNGQKSLDFLRLERKMANASPRGILEYKRALKDEKKGLFRNPKKTPKKFKNFCIIGMIIIIIIITYIMLIVSKSVEEAIAILFLLSFITLVYSVVFSVVEGGIFIYVFLIFHCACFQGAIIGILVSSGIGILYIPYILMFLLIQYVARIKKYSKNERQMVESIAGLKRYIKNYSLLKEKDSLDYIALWEDYFIMAIALGLNNKIINYFYEYGKSQNSNLGVSMHNINSFKDFHNNISNSFYTYQHVSNVSSSSSSGSRYSGSSGGFSGGSSSGGGGGRRWRRKSFLKI